MRRKYINNAFIFCLLNHLPLLYLTRTFTFSASRAVKCCFLVQQHKKREESYEDDDDIVISSTIVFADRKASTEAAETSNTATALAELHAHIAGLPDSSRKRKLIGLVGPLPFSGLVGP